MRGPRNKEKELSTKITKLGNEIQAPLVFNFTEGNELPVKGETEKEKKYLELIQQNTDCIKVQEQLYSTPRKNMAGLDKKIKEINKQCFEIIKSSQKKMTQLKKEERILIMDIIKLQKNLGLVVELKKPMIKTGFYIPERLQLKPLNKDKEEDTKKPLMKEIKLKSKNIPNELILPTQNPKPKNQKLLRKNIRKKIAHLKIKTKKKLTKTNSKIESLIEQSEENESELTSEEKLFLSQTKQENTKAKKEIDEWLEFILSELISSYEQRNEMNIEKLKQIEKKLGNFKKGETLIKSEKNKDKENANHEVYCNQFKGNIVGIRYKCLVCEEFNFCEKCEDKFKDEHAHPMLKIYNKDMCPISINCSFIEDK